MTASVFDKPGTLRTEFTGKLRALTVGVIAVLWLPINCSSGSAAGADDLVARLPLNSQLVLVTDDLHATCQAMQKTDLGAKICGKEFAPLVAALRKADRAAPLYIRPWFGLDWPDLATHRGPATLTVFTQTDGAPAIALVFAGAPNSPQSQAILKSASEYLAGNKWTSKKWAKQGGTFTTFESPEGNRAIQRLTWFEGDAIFGIATTDLAATTIVAAPASATLDQTSARKHLSSAAERSSSAEVRLFAQPLPLWNALRKMRGTKPQGRDYLITAQRLGLSGIPEVGGRFAFDQNESQFESTFELIATRPYLKAMRALKMKPGPMMPLPVWIDDRAERVTMWRWDFAEAIRAIGSVFDEISYPGPDGDGLFDQMIESLATDPEGPKIDLRKDLFPLLGPHFTEATFELTASPGELPQSVTLTEVECVKDKQVAAILKSYVAGDAEVKAEKIAGYDVWSTDDDGALFAAGESKAAMTIRCVAVGHGRAIFGTRRKVLTDTLKLLPEGAPVRLSQTNDWKNFDAWRKKVDQKSTSLRSWSKPDRWSESYKLASQPVPAKSNRPQAPANAASKPVDDEAPAIKLWRLILFGSAEHSSDLPYAAAPSFDTWKKSLHPTGIVMSRTDKGWKIELSSLPLASQPAE